MGDKEREKKIERKTWMGEREREIEGEKDRKRDRGSREIERKTGAGERGRH